MHRLILASSLALLLATPALGDTSKTLFPSVRKMECAESFVIRGVYADAPTGIPLYANGDIVLVDKQPRVGGVFEGHGDALAIKTGRGFRFIEAETLRPGDKAFNEQSEFFRRAPLEYVYTGVPAEFPRAVTEGSRWILVDNNKGAQSLEVTRGSETVDVDSLLNGAQVTILDGVPPTVTVIGVSAFPVTFDLTVYFINATQFPQTIKADASTINGLASFIIPAQSLVVFARIQDGEWFAR